MLHWLINYLNSNGYYFYDYNYNNCNFSNDVSNQQEYYSRRRRRGRGSRKKNSNSNNEPQQVEAENLKAKETANLKKGLETKLEEGNKGYDLLKKMGYESGKGLGKNAEGIVEPLKVEKKGDRKGLGVTGETSHASKRQEQKAVVKPHTTIAQKALVAETVQQKPKQTEVINLKTKQPVQKVKPQPHDVPATNGSKIITTTSTKASTSIKTVTKVNVSTKETIPPAPKPEKGKFSVKDPCTPQFLNSLERAFHCEIELMQLRLAAEASIKQVADDNDFIVAKIYIDHNPNVPKHVFDFVRNELVGWIGVYQSEDMDTPIFHSMNNNDSHITIVCDNNYAFECLQRCVDDIVQMKTMDSLKVLRLPPITAMVYCCDAMYEGISTDDDLFLSQLHLHKPKLYTDNWVVVSREVCSDERKTYFIFLIDERSALALNFCYSRSFYVCMQKVTFRNRGIVREKMLN